MFTKDTMVSLLSQAELNFKDIFELSKDNLFKDYNFNGKYFEENDILIILQAFKNHLNVHVEEIFYDDMPDYTKENKVNFNDLPLNKNVTYPTWTDVEGMTYGFIFMKESSDENTKNKITICAESYLKKALDLQGDKFIYSWQDKKSMSFYIVCYDEEKMFRRDFYFEASNEGITFLW